MPRRVHVQTRTPDRSSLAVVLQRASLNVLALAHQVSSRSEADAISSLQNFSFAPQRFSSRERPLTRFVAFSKAVMEPLVLESHCETQKRADWASGILKKLNGSTWVLIGMLADLSEDLASRVSSVT